MSKAVRLTMIALAVASFLAIGAFAVMADEAYAEETYSVTWNAADDEIISVFHDGSPVANGDEFKSGMTLG